MATPKRMRDYLREAAGYLLNTIIALVIFNVVLGVYFHIHDARHARLARDTNPVFERYPSLGKEIVNLYPGMTMEEVSHILYENWSRPLEPQAITGFGEAPFHGKYVNVSEHGFRVGTAQGPWPPVHDGKNFVVFLFGGSTTFGYGVDDDQALGSRLQPLLAKKLGRPVTVYNFGQAKWASTQERLLFEKLMMMGQKPDLAIFVDGLNDFEFAWGDEEFNWIREVTEGKAASPKQVDPGWGTWLHNGIRMLPMTRLAIALHQKISPPKGGLDGHRGTDEVGHVFYDAKTKFDEQAVLQRVIDRYFFNKRMIEADGKEFSVRTLFVWQPVPTYEYDLKYHPFAQIGSGQIDFGDIAYSLYGYPMVRDTVARTHPDNFLWCADIQKDLHEPLYVDLVHYSPKMTDMVAGCIAQGVQ